jgi:hypothetical protein
MGLQSNMRKSRSRTKSKVKVSPTGSDVKLWLGCVLYGMIFEKASRTHHGALGSTKKKP